jgi:hypothetical protein
MSRSRSLLLCTCALAFTCLLAGGGTSQAQTTAAPPARSFVYVSSPEVGGEGANQIQGWSVASDGSLTPVPGSPYGTSEQIGEIASSPRFLFGDLNNDGNQSIGS